MGCISDEDGTMFMCGNFAERTDKKPKDFDYQSDGKWYEPYPKELERITIGRTTCDCTRIKTDYAPWYGFTWSHSDECALIKRVKEHPQLRNLWCFDGVETIGYSE